MGFTDAHTTVSPTWAPCGSPLSHSMPNVRSHLVHLLPVANRVHLLVPSRDGGHSVVASLTHTNDFSPVHSRPR